MEEDERKQEKHIRLNKFSIDVELLDFTAADQAKKYEKPKNSRED